MDPTAARDPAALERRRFIADTARAACGAGIVGLLLALHARKADALPATALRPPGALAEADFLGACVRCGLCVRDCPYKILDLARIESAPATGTPTFTARTGPCEMCDDVPCVKACPTGALDPKLTDIDKARMGLAVLVDHEACLNFQGLRCDVCYRVCPRLDQAITLEPQHNQRTTKHTLFIPTVHSEHCTGCGKCEQGCVLETAAIRVFPLHLAKGAGGSHYRMGWEEKAKAGRSLIDERGMIEMPKRLPEAPAAAEVSSPGRPKAAAPPWGAGAEGASGVEVTR